MSVRIFPEQIAFELVLCVKKMALTNASFSLLRALIRRKSRGRANPLALLEQEYPCPLTHDISASEVLGLLGSD